MKAGTGSDFNPHRNSVLDPTASLVHVRIWAFTIYFQARFRKHFGDTSMKAGPYFVPHRNSVLDPAESLVGIQVRIWAFKYISRPGSASILATRRWRLELDLTLFLIGIRFWIQLRVWSMSEFELSRYISRPGSASILATRRWKLELTLFLMGIRFWIQLGVWSMSEFERSWYIFLGPVPQAFWRHVDAKQQHANLSKGKILLSWQ